MSYQAVIRLLGASPTTGQHSTASIAARVNLTGTPISRRSVERGLANLADQPLPPILRNGDQAGGYQWSWTRNHPLMSHAHREAEIAGTVLLHRMARNLLPPIVATRLADDERRARGDLARNPTGDMAWWLDHVVALPPGPQRHPRPIREGVFEAVSEALWKRRQLQVEYRRRGSKEWKTRTVHPLGLVQDGYLLYLVGALFDFDNPVHLALMRMRNPEVLPASARTLPEFDLQRQVAEQFAWPYGERQPIEFWIHAERMIELEELPIAKDQRIEKVAGPDGYHRVTATVAPSLRFDAFLRSFGDEVYWSADE